MAKLADTVQYNKDGTWLAALVVAVSVSDATRLTLRVFSPSASDKQYRDVAQGTSPGQWREIPVV